MNFKEVGTHKVWCGVMETIFEEQTLEEELKKAYMGNGRIHLIISQTDEDVVKVLKEVEAR